MIVAQKRYDAGKDAGRSSNEFAGSDGFLPYSYFLLIGGLLLTMFSARSPIWWMSWRN